MSGKHRLAERVPADKGFCQARAGRLRRVRGDSCHWFVRGDARGRFGGCRASLRNMNNHIWVIQPSRG